MDTTTMIEETSQLNPVAPLTRTQYEETILRRLSLLPLDRLAQLANFARFLEFELGQLQSQGAKPQEEAPTIHAGRADELLAAFAGREILIYTPVAENGAARMLAEALGRDEYGNKQLP